MPRMGALADASARLARSEPCVIGNMEKEAKVSQIESHESIVIWVCL
jgi:hypothetical protein